MKERSTFTINAYAGFVLVAILIIAIYMLMPFINDKAISAVSSSIALILGALAFLLITSIRVIEPNQAKVLIFFGTYLGTIRKSGIFMTVPLAKSIDISLRVRNFNSNTLKVNDIEVISLTPQAVLIFHTFNSWIFSMNRGRCNTFNDREGSFTQSTQHHVYLPNYRSTINQIILYPFYLNNSI